MPYIAQKDRPKYDPKIEETTRYLLMPETPSRDPMNVAEHFGYFVFALTKTYLRANGACYLKDTSFIRHSPRNLAVHPETQVILNGIAENLVDILQTSSDVLACQCGDMNYILSSIMWGILGDMDGAPEGRYALRCFLKGALHWVLTDYIPHCIDIRYYILLQGVLTDVIDETYRRKTAPYEDVKIEQNGDLWPLEVSDTAPAS